MSTATKTAPRSGATDVVTNIVLAGVGGQGSVLSGQIVADAVRRAGWNVVTSEVHGMAQRGGSVVSTVRFGHELHSPVVPEAGADFLIAFERLEALRHLPFLRPGGVALVNDQRITPPIESLKVTAYPDDIEAPFRQRAGTLLLVPGLETAKRLGNTRLANTVVLGVLATFLDLPERAWREAIAGHVPPRTVEANQQAFAEGIAWARAARGGS